MGASKPIKRIVQRGVIDFVAALFIFVALLGVIKATEGHALSTKTYAESVVRSDAYRLIGVTGLIGTTQTAAAAPSEAYAIASQPPSFVASGAESDGPAMIAIIGIAFAAMAAFNLAFVRHVLRVAFAGTGALGGRSG